MNYQTINCFRIGPINEYLPVEWHTRMNKNEDLSVDYTTTEKAAIIWAVPIGTLLGSFPVNYLYTKYGARLETKFIKAGIAPHTLITELIILVSMWPFFAAGVTSALSTTLIPTAALYDLKALLVVRFVQGLAFAANFGAIGLLCLRWAPLSEISIFAGILTSFTPVSSVITNPVSAWMCTDYGWPSAFYIHAVFGFILFLLWITFYTDDPQTHRIVTEQELAQIQKGKTKEHIERDSFVPYKVICFCKQWQSI
ncbi:unnamed protein product [Strongylus vulgaris]|uniref:Major facilitator superfamily (MFS) profile domain-containing protein n=1 Tax=Strongylus vulgaris TaxID=40348 RepID=A0A3P7LNK6_STRVU|nr:unnamed protein product [Strongylus vulgaris]